MLDRLPVDVLHEHIFTRAMLVDGFLHRFARTCPAGAATAVTVAENVLHCRTNDLVRGARASAVTRGDGARPVPARLTEEHEQQAREFLETLKDGTMAQTVER